MAEITQSAKIYDDKPYGLNSKELGLIQTNWEKINLQCYRHESMSTGPNSRVDTYPFFGKPEDLLNGILRRTASEQNIPMQSSFYPKIAMYLAALTRIGVDEKSKSASLLFSLRKSIGATII